MSSLDAMILLPEDALWMACRGGAAAFGQPDLIGSLEPGKKADVVLVDLNTPLAMPVHKPVSALVYNLAARDVDTVIVDGKVLMRGKRILCVDEDRSAGRSPPRVRGCSSAPEWRSLGKPRRPLGFPKTPKVLKST